MGDAPAIEICPHCSAARDDKHPRPWRCRRCMGLVPWSEQPPHGVPIDFGPYTLIRRIAAGGMGVVYEARRKTVQGFEKSFALKRLLPSLSEDREFIDMLVDEAKLSAQLQHPNIVQTFELDRVGREYYIAMEYVAGGTLATLLRFCAATQRLLPVAVALHLLAEALKGLAHAHGSGDGQTAIIHRDVSPQNLMLGRDVQVKLTDFGIAKAIASSTVSRMGTIKGKLAYMAPELLSGQRATQRVDIFSMGVLMHEAFTCRRLFRAESEAALISKLLRAPIAPLSQFRRDVPRSIEHVVGTALNRDPDRRYANGAELRNALLEAMPPGMMEAGLVDCERFVSQYYKWVGLPGEPLDPDQDGPLGQRSASVAMNSSFTPSASDSFPMATTSGLSASSASRLRWVGIAAALVGVGLLGWFGLTGAQSSSAGWGEAEFVIVATSVDAAGEKEGVPPISVDAASAAEAKSRDAGRKHKARPPRTLTRKDIVRTFRRSMAKLNACGARHRDNLPKGGVQVALLIEKNGKVKEAMLRPESLRDSGLDRCLAKVVARMRFPAHRDAEMRVTVPLDFQFE